MRVSITLPEDVIADVLATAGEPRPTPGSRDGKFNRALVTRYRGLLSTVAVAQRQIDELSELNRKLVDAMLAISSSRNDATPAPTAAPEAAGDWNKGSW
jgi:hypothetical protein